MRRCRSRGGGINIVILSCLLVGVRPGAGQTIVDAGQTSSDARQNSVDAQQTTPDAALTTEVWREPSVPLDLHWHLLSIPERTVELAFLPIGMLVEGIEKVRLGRRIYDLLRNDAGTIVVNPKLKLSAGDSLGAGASLSIKSKRSNTRKFGIGGLWQLNSDREWKVGYRHSIVSLEGRVVSLRVTGEVDRDVRVYGDNNSEKEDKRVLRSDTTEVGFTADLTSLGSIDIVSRLELGFLREKLSSGDSPSTPSVGSVGDTIAPPPGFGFSRDYPWARIVVRRDTRDTVARTTRGSILELSGRITTDVNGDDLTALSGQLRGQWFIPVFPERRILALGGGFAAVGPLRTGGRVPFHKLVKLDGSHHLRGYDSGRFRDRVGWWANLEYQYPLYEYQTTGVALSAAWFFDIGRVGSSFGDVFGTPLRYSGGIAVRGERETFRIFSFQLGWSPEGPQLAFVLGKDL